MYRKIIKIIFTFLSLNILLLAPIFAQTQKSISVKDTNGDPISGAVVTIGETSKPVYTDEKGEFQFQWDNSTRIPILLEAEGYYSQLIIATPATVMESIVLEKALFQKTEKDKVNMPFGEFKQRNIPGAVVALDTREIQKYDQQNSYSGILSGRIPGLFGSTNFRQFGSPVIVVDGIPRPANDYNLEQIEQITVIKDLASGMLYGSQAQNGVILITTRRGKPLKKSMHFTVETGINKPIAYPEYLNAAEYMELYNEALANDNLDPRYPDDVISNTRNGSDPVRFPNVDYYNSTYLHDYYTHNNVVGEASGGNDIGQYYLNLGWRHDNSLLKAGEGDNESNDRLNMRGNVDYKLTDYIKVTFDGAAIFNFSRAPRYSSASNDFWALSTTLRPDIAPDLIPVELMEDEDLLGSAKLVNGKYLLGGTSEYRTNVFGELTLNGNRKVQDRLIEISTGLDFDLRNITPGLSASALFSFNMFNLFTADIENSYAVYRPNYGGNNTIQSWSKYGTDIKVESQTLSDVNFYRRIGAYGTVNYNRIFDDVHEVSVNAIGYGDDYSIEGATQSNKHLHFGVRGHYAYDNKYIAELTGVFTGSQKLFESTPWSFAPGIGLGWILSEESFLSDNSLIDYLKLRTNLAIVNTDESISEYYLSRNLYSSSGTYYYNHGVYYNNGRVIRLGNPNIGFEKHLNYNLGFESMLMDYKLGIEASYFYYKNYDVITRRVNLLPDFIVSPPYENYESYQTQGVELGLNYSQKVGEVEFNLGSNFAYSVPKVLIMDELQYEEDYRRQTGRESDAYFGYVALGLFKDEAEIESSPTQTFGVVKPGDIKYEDLNSDGVIDILDQKIIGNSRSRFHYGVNLHVKYKFVELFGLGTGHYGQNSYFNNSYYWIYADRKYSAEVLNRWTPATAETATYPRLTTQSNPNNFRNSTFWLYDNNRFTLHTAQITFLLPKIGGIQDARVFLRGNNLFTVSKIKDKIQLNVGSAPQERIFSLGLNISL